MTETEKWQIEMRRQSKFAAEMFKLDEQGSAGAWYEKDVLGLFDGNSVHLVGRSHVFETVLLAALQVEGIGTVTD
jgi:hypothetical protein